MNWKKYSNIQSNLKKVCITYIGGHNKVIFVYKLNQSLIDNAKFSLNFIVNWWMKTSKFRVNECVCCQLIFCCHITFCWQTTFCCQMLILDAPLLHCSPKCILSKYSNAGWCQNCQIYKMFLHTHWWLSIQHTASKHDFYCLMAALCSP